MDLEEGIVEHLVKMIAWLRDCGTGYKGREEGSIMQGGNDNRRLFAKVQGGPQTTATWPRDRT